ncbi:MAG: hypothetical protein WBB39_03730 [Candidatus Saccharimonadales bacterium]
MKSSLHYHLDRQTTQPTEGFVLIAVMILTFFVIAAGTVTAQLASSNLRAANIETYRVNAQFAVDAGADESVYEVNKALINNTSWTGTGTEKTVSDQSTFKTTYISDVDDVTVNGEDRKILTITGKTYSPKTASSPLSSRTYKVTLRPIEAGDFSVVTGVGGLIMENSSKIIGGSVFVNGSITMSNSSQIGLSNAPVDVFAAHQNCPIGGGASYPTQCGSGNGEPISISNPAWIYGEVRAQNQVTGNRMSNTGLVANSSVTPKPLPTHDRTAQKNAINAANNRTGADASCTTNGGTKTWLANTKITGNVTVNKSCTVTVEGDIWITGNLNMAQSGTIKVKNGLTTPPVIMIDGAVVAQNSATFASNNGTPPIGFRLIAYKSAAACSPDCSDVTGTDLYNSRNIVTIQLQNTSSGPNTEFYSRWTKVSLENGGGIGAVVGQTVHLRNSTAITFGVKVTGVPSIYGWVIESYRRDYTPL